MHDGIHVEKAGVPSVTICTDSFVRTATSMAAMWGTPDYPTIFTKHPTAALDKSQLRARAEEMLPKIVSILTGVEATAPVE